MAMSDRARRLLLTADGAFLAVVGAVQILFELVGYYRGAGPFGELFGLLGGQHQTEPKYRTRVIPRAALWISQKMTPRPDGVVTEAVTVWPAAIDLCPAAATQPIDKLAGRDRCVFAKTDRGAVAQGAPCCHLVTGYGRVEGCLHTTPLPLAGSPEAGEESRCASDALIAYAVPHPAGSRSRCCATAPRCADTSNVTPAAMTTSSIEIADHGRADHQSKSR